MKRRYVLPVLFVLVACRPAGAEIIQVPFYWGLQLNGRHFFSAFEELAQDKGAKPASFASDSDIGSGGFTVIAVHNAPANGVRLAPLPTTYGMEVDVEFDGDLQNTTYGGSAIATPSIIGLGLTMPTRSVSGPFGSLNFIDDTGFLTTSPFVCTAYLPGQGVSWAHGTGVAVDVAYGEPTRPFSPDYSLGVASLMFFGRLCRPPGGDGVHNPAHGTTVLIPSEVPDGDERDPDPDKPPTHIPEPAPFVMVATGLFAVVRRWRGTPSRRV